MFQSTKAQVLSSLVAASTLLFSGAGIAAESLICQDGTSFNAGQIRLTEDVKMRKVLLRGYETHGRTVSDLARDFGITLPEAGYLSWVGVEFPKPSCLFIDQKRPVVGCLAPTGVGQVVFYSGWDPRELQEVARRPAEVTLAVDQLSFSTVAPDGYFGEGAALETDENTRATIYVTSITNDEHSVYRSTVGVQIESRYCRTDKQP